MTKDVDNPKTLESDQDSHTIGEPALAEGSLQADTTDPDEVAKLHNETSRTATANRNELDALLLSNRAVSADDFIGNLSDIRNRMSEGTGNIEISSHWSVPWSDLMMVMFVMFVVLYTMEVAERNVQELIDEPPPEFSAGAEEHPLPDLDKSQAAIIQQLIREKESIVAETNLENIDVILTDKQAIKVSVRGPLLFDPGRADLKDDAMDFLDRLSYIISRNNYEINIAGHTDNFPISTDEFPNNWELSAIRASRVARYLIQSGNLDPGRFSVIGHSMYRPVAMNNNRPNKAKNRRVEIIITRNEYQP